MMKHTVSRELFAYWDDLRNGRTAPERSAIDPADIRELLPYTLLLEMDEPRRAMRRTARLRLSGTRLNSLFHRDLRGECFADLWPRDDIGALIEAVLDDRYPAVAGVRAGPERYPPADFELLLLPLRHNGATHSRLLGSLAALATPSWSGLLPVTGLQLGSHRFVTSRDETRFGTREERERPAMIAGSPSLAGASRRPMRLLTVYQADRAPRTVEKPL